MIWRVVLVREAGLGVSEAAPVTSEETRSVFVPGIGRGYYIAAFIASILLSKVDNIACVGSYFVEYRGISCQMHNQVEVA